MKGIRADVRMVELGLAPTREKAKSIIMSGMAMINGKVIDKAGTTVATDEIIEIKDNTLPYVSRGGLKLEKAIKYHGVTLEGLVALDVGSSTGGFTDCMLQNGAKKVYSIDVGYGQLDWKLRCDERVVVMERTNARNMESSWFDEVPEFASIDVSFISVRLILPNLRKCLKTGSQLVVLVKPQFEVGKGKVGKNGVVRSSELHKEVFMEIAQFAYNSGFDITSVDFSPITGPKGNIEFLLLLKTEADIIERELPENIQQDIENSVITAHETLRI